MAWLIISLTAEQFTTLHWHESAYNEKKKHKKANKLHNEWNVKSTRLFLIYLRKKKNNIKMKRCESS